MVDWLAVLRNAASVRWLPRVAQLVESVSQEIGPMEKLWRVHAVCAALLILVGGGMASPNAGVKLKPVFDENTYPAKALAMLNPSQRIFADDEWGDYLIYRLSPNGTKVFVDGRSDFYGSKFGQDYIDLMNVQHNWEQTLNRYRVDTILLSPRTALASAIKESSHWRVVYDDGIAIVFRPAVERAGTIEKITTSRLLKNWDSLQFRHEILLIAGETRRRNWLAVPIFPIEKITTSRFGGQKLEPRRVGSQISVGG